MAMTIWKSFTYLFEDEDKDLRIKHYDDVVIENEGIQNAYIADIYRKHSDWVCNCNVGDVLQTEYATITCDCIRTDEYEHQIQNNFRRHREKEEKLKDTIEYLNDIIEKNEFVK